MNVAPNNSRIDFSFLVSPRRDKDKPIYRWHSYKHSFSKELVDNFIEEFKLNEDSMVLDPFVGSGTTLLACKDKKISGIGYDISPFAVFLTKTKLRNYNKNRNNRPFFRYPVVQIYLKPFLPHRYNNPSLLIDKPILRSIYQ